MTDGTSTVAASQDSRLESRTIHDARCLLCNTCCVGEVACPTLYWKLAATFCGWPPRSMSIGVGRIANQLGRSWIQILVDLGSIV